MNRIFEQCAAFGRFFYGDSKMSIVDEAKKKVLEANDKIDAKVDSKIDKEQASRFSWLKLVGGAAVLLIILGVLAAY